MESFGCVHLLSSFLFLIHFLHKDHLHKDFSQEKGRPAMLMLCSRGHKLVACTGYLQAAVSLPEWLRGWT